MLKVVLASLIIIFICMVLFSIKIILKKNGRFPNTHVGGNSALRKKGINCAQSQDIEVALHKNLFDRLKEESN